MDTCASRRHRGGILTSAFSKTSRPCSSRFSWVTTLVVTLLVCQAHSASGRRRFFLWLKKGGDLQQKLSMKYPIFLVDDGQHGNDFDTRKAGWTYLTPPIDANVNEYEFQWKALSKNVRYDIIVSSQYPHLMPTPTVVGVPLNGTVPREGIRSFSIRFPCHPEADGQVVMINMEFRFYKGAKRRIPLFEPGEIMLQLRRSCPRRRRHMTQVEHQPECKRICGLQRRQGQDLREAVCHSNYVIRANITQQYNPLYPERGLMIRVDKQYRTLKAGVKDDKALFADTPVSMFVSYDISDCDCIRYLRAGEQYVFFATMQDGRPVFTGTSLAALYNKKARRVLKRLRETKSVCRDGNLISFGDL